MTCVSGLFRRFFVAKFIGDNNPLKGCIFSAGGGFRRVATAGGEVVAFLVNPAQSSGSTALAIHPERIAVAPTPGVHANEFEAEVEDILFLGQHLRLRRLGLGGGASLSPPSPTPQARAFCRLGGRVRIGCLATDYHALEDES